MTKTKKKTNTNPQVHNNIPFLSLFDLTGTLLNFALVNPLNFPKLRRTHNLEWTPSLLWCPPVVNYDYPLLLSY